MFSIDHRLIPPTIEHAPSNLTSHTDPEVLHRRTLFAKAFAGNEEARAILRNSYHLTHCVINSHDILNEQQKHNKKRATPQQ